MSASNPTVSSNTPLPKNDYPNTVSSSGAGTGGTASSTSALSIFLPAQDIDSFGGIITTKSDEPLLRDDLRGTMGTPPDPEQALLTLLHGIGFWFPCGHECDIDLSGVNFSRGVNLSRICHLARTIT